MIGTYKQINGGKEVYVHDFTVALIGKGLEDTGIVMVLFKEKSSKSKSFVMSKENFDSEFKAI